MNELCYNRFFLLSGKNIYTFIPVIDTYSNIGHTICINLRIVLIIEIRSISILMDMFYMKNSMIWIMEEII